MSTPPRTLVAGSPMRRSRKSTSCLSPASPKLQIRANDDKQEKTMRRRSKLAEINHNSPYRSSPLKKANREVPATAKLSNDQLSALISATIEGQVKRKITSKNAFEWNLIDYLSEICTTQDNVDMPSFSTLANVIDASGEIYASKVEHLLADTIKVRTDLSRSSTGKSAANEDDNADDAPTKTKAHRFSGNTIVKNVSTITMDKLDLEFSVDPLFRKTSAAFDQGGARGLLLNHLTTQGLSELKFDSSDSTDPVSLAKSVTSSPLDMAIVRELFPFAEINESKPQICPEFASFKFSGWDPATSKEMSNDDGAHNDVESAPTQTMTVDTEYTEDVYEQDDDVAFDQSFSEMPESEEPFTTDGADGVVDTHRQANSSKREVVLLQNNTFGWLEGNVGGAGGWHGGSEFSVASKKGLKKGGVSKAVKKAKFILKFELDLDWKKLLGASRAATTLAKSTTEASVSNLLPDDLQRAAKDLTTLFLMPKRQGKVLTRKYGDSEDDGNMDDWANGSTFGDDAYIPNDSNGDEYNDNDSHIPLFDGCDDDDDDNEQDDMDMDIPAGPQSDENGNLKLIENVRQVQKINIGYAQKPKIMDIKKLKASIWDEISENKNTSSTTTTSEGSTAEERPLLFNQLVTDVPHKVSSKMAENLSVPIMFVCLLYLANDKELRISGVDSMENLQILQKAE